MKMNPYYFVSEKKSFLCIIKADSDNVQFCPQGPLYKVWAAFECLWYVADL